MFSGFRKILSDLLLYENQNFLSQFFMNFMKYMHSQAINCWEKNNSKDAISIFSQSLLIHSSGVVISSESITQTTSWLLYALLYKPTFSCHVRVSYLVALEIESHFEFYQREKFR